MEELSPSESPPPPEIESEALLAVSLEAMTDNPQLFRNQLMLLLTGLPWDRSVRHIEGTQAINLVKFCADSENLDLIPQAETNIYARGETVSEDTGYILKALNAAITNGIRKQIDPGEQAARKRLLAWVEHLDLVMAASQVKGIDDDPSTTGAHAA